jgi:pimeloyl-ACP methyl ester carboxylesterase
LKRKFLTRATLIPLALVGVGVALWFGAATFVTYRILHPPFLDGGYGDVFFATEKERASAPLGIDPLSCCNATFENLRITDDNGISVDAWFVPGSLPSAVLLIPASGGSKRAMLPYLKFLHSVGLPVLLIDNSDFARGRAGWGWNDRGIVRGAAETLRQKGFSIVAALGVSEGAAAALIIQGETPGLFKTIVADSSFANLGATLRSNPSLAGLNPAFLQTVTWELGRALGRSPDEISPASSSARIASCALLIIQNEKDPLTPESDGRKIVEARIGDANRRLYIAPSEGHGDAIYRDPTNYQTTVLDFLARNLLGAAPIVPR